MTIDPHQEAEYLADLIADEYCRAEVSLSDYVKRAFSVLEPGKQYSHSWHIDYTCEYLEAVYHREILRIIFNIPPRLMKSIAITVAFPTWVWGPANDPSKQFMCASYSDRLSNKHSRDRRHLITSPWYQDAWGDRFELTADDNQVQKFSNTARGHQMATSVGGSGTGEGYDIGIIDDPLNPKQAASDVERKRANEWRDQTWSNRKNSKDAAEIVVMQRLHEKDLTGHLLGKGGWEHVCLPMEAPTRVVVKFPRSGRKVTRKEGAILHPERFGKKEVAQYKLDMGPTGYPAQYGQDPKPAGGGTFKREWWRRYSEVPKDIIRIRQFWDTAQEPGISNDYSVGATIAETPLGYIWLQVKREKVAWPELEAMVKDTYYEWNAWSHGDFSSGVEAVVIEKKSSGHQLLQQLERKTKIPVQAFNPGKRSKIVRATGATPTVAAGNCYLPADSPWVEMFISEHEKFPFGEYDDQVDTTSMAIEDFSVDSEPEVF